MQRNRHSWIGCINPAAGPMPEFGPMGSPFNCLFHRDDDTGVQTGYYVGEDSAPEEPVFVPKGPDAGESEGYLLSLVGRRALNRYDLIIPGRPRHRRRPVATVQIPFRLRYGFHGTWVPGEELRHA